MNKRSISVRLDKIESKIGSKEQEDFGSIYKSFVFNEISSVKFANKFKLELKKVNKVIEFGSLKKWKKILNDATKKESLPSALELENSIERNCDNIFEQDLIKRRFCRFRGIITIEDRERHFEEHKNRVFAMLGEIMMRDVAKKLFENEKINELMQRLTIKKLEEILKQIE